MLKLMIFSLIKFIIKKIIFISIFLNNLCYLLFYLIKIYFNIIIYRDSKK